MTAPERISASLAFAKWTKTQGAKWNLGAMWEDGKFVKFMAPDTDTAWLAFSAAWNRRADLHDAALAAAKAEGIREGMMKAAEMVAPSVPDCECIDCAKAEVYAAAIREAAGDAA